MTRRADLGARVLALSGHRLQHIRTGTARSGVLCQASRVACGMCIVYTLILMRLFKTYASYIRWSGDEFFCSLCLSSSDLGPCVCVVGEIDLHATDARVKPVCLSLYVSCAMFMCNFSMCIEIPPTRAQSASNTHMAALAIPKL
jgi:hypothetical protein